MAKPLIGILQDLQIPADYINFESWDPPTKSRDPVYDDVTVRGRSEPHVFYSHTGPQIWNWNMRLVASFDQGDGGLPLGVQEKAQFIESLTMPDYGVTPGQTVAVKPPHLARIRILRMVDLIGTIRNLQQTYREPYDINTGQPHIIECSFQFYCQRTVNQNPLGYADIRRLTARGQNRFTGNG